MNPPDTIDPLKPVYRESFIENPKHQQDLANRDTALLCIDMQYLDAAEGHGLFKDDQSSPIPLNEMRYYFDRLKDLVLPMSQPAKLFSYAALRSSMSGFNPLPAMVAIVPRGISGSTFTLGSADACFIEEVAPVGDEIIINKTASGVFSSTNLNYVLKNMEIIPSMWLEFIPAIAKPPFGCL